MTDANLRDTMLRSRLTLAMIEALQTAWPGAIDLSPTTLDPPFEDVDEAFLDALHGLVDEGLVMVEALLVGAPGDPVAHQAALTRKGATVLHQVMRQV